MFNDLPINEEEYTRGDDDTHHEGDFPEETGEIESNYGVDYATEACDSALKEKVDGGGYTN